MYFIARRFTFCRVTHNMPFWQQELIISVVLFVGSLNLMDVIIFQNKILFMKDSVKAGRYLLGILHIKYLGQQGSWREKEREENDGNEILKRGNDKSSYIALEMKRKHGGTKNKHKHTKITSVGKTKMRMRRKRRKMKNVEKCVEKRLPRDFNSLF